MGFQASKREMLFNETDDTTDIKYKVTMLTESSRSHVEAKEPESSLEWWRSSPRIASRDSATVASLRSKRSRIHGRRRTTPQSR